MNVEPLSPETLAGLAALHVPLWDEPRCAIDREAWPCQTARLLATVDDLRLNFRRATENDWPAPAFMWADGQWHDSPESPR